MILLQKVEPHGDIIVGKIVRIFTCDQTVYFYTRQFRSSIDQHTRSYIMNEQNTFSLVTTQDLVDCYPLSFYKVRGRKHFVIKHLVFNEEEYLSWEYVILIYLPKLFANYVFFYKCMNLNTAATVQFFNLQFKDASKNALVPESFVFTDVNIHDEMP